jgi:1-acyl-sn-glycerol-3-phosphate acyltransferase
MNRLPLRNVIPYRFLEPRVSPFWVRASRLFIKYLLRRLERVRGIEFVGLDHLKSRLGRGDGVLITPNHPDMADCGVMFELGRRVGRPFCYMAAYQIFAGSAGLKRFILPRLGVFPVDREGADRHAFATGIDILQKGRNPLVVFPEGEVYHLADRLTPLREGAAAVAISAAKRLGEAGKKAWIVPVAIKYRFCDGCDPLPELHDLMDDLETRFTWSIRPGRPLVDRLYLYAEGLLALKELEYLGGPRPGPLRERIASLRSFILDRMEDRRLGRRSDEPTPVRIKELRRSCLAELEGLTESERSGEPEAADRAQAVRQELADLFVALQLFSYPGDYVRECPTIERAAEILTKFEQDAVGVAVAAPRGPRRAVVHLGEPIDLGSYLPKSGRTRDAVATLTSELEARIQGLLDAIGSGRPLPAEGIGAPPTLAESPL